MSLHRIGAVVTSLLLLLSLAGCVVHEHRGGGRGHYERPPHWRR